MNDDQLVARPGPGNRSSGPAPEPERPPRPSQILAVHGERQGAILARNSEEVMRIAKIAAVLLGGRESVETVAGKIMTGAELGLPPMTSTRLIHIVEGAPTLSAEVMRAIVLQSHLCNWFVVHEAVGSGDDLAVTAEASRITRTGDQVQSRTAVLRDFAHMPKRSSKGRALPWGSTPGAMLTARATSQLIRVQFPDVISGIYLADEVRDVTADTDAPPAMTEPPPAAAAPAAPPSAATDANFTDLPPDPPAKEQPPLPMQGEETEPTDEQG